MRRFNVDREIRQANQRIQMQIESQYRDAWHRIEAMFREEGWEPPAPPIEEHPAYAVGLAYGQMNRALREMGEAIAAGFRAGDRG